MSAKKKPRIEVGIYRADRSEKSSLWRTFGKHHYLSHSHNNAAEVFFATVNGDLAGFCSVLPLPHTKLIAAFKEHRTVVLPDFQGIGVGVALRNFVADLYSRQGREFRTVTSNPALIHHMTASPLWACCNFGRIRGGNSTTSKINFGEVANSGQRITTSWVYIGHTLSAP